ncbi:MAG TPA: FecR domain-containing protein [Longimicrobiales bacterium]|nr:FecR domain-containing protein [Longimicrobiales bacterium]
MIRMLVAAVLALALPLLASAAAVVESANGIVRAGESAISAGQRVTAPVSVATGAGSQVTLKFDDDMQIVLDQNSLLRIVEFRSTGDRANDRAVLELLRGGARVVTGRMVMENPMQFFFRTPQAQLMVERPADLSVVIVNPTYVTLNSGSVMVSNGWGTVRLAAGTDTAVVASNNVAPGLMARSELPASVAVAMQNLNVASVGLPAGGSAAGAAPTAATGEGMRPGVAAILIGLGVAAAVAAGGGGGDGAVTPPPQH